MPDYRKVARRAAQKYGLDAGVFERQIQQESGFNPSARSPAGAQGIAQIMPATAKGWGVDPSDPTASLDAAAKNMASYVKKYGSYKNALVAYNAGPGRVGGALPAETQNYIKVILGGKDPGKLGSAQEGSDASGTTTSLKFSPGAAVNVAQALMAAEAPKAPQRTITAPPLPERLTPKGYVPVQTTSTTSEQDTHSDLSQQLAALQAVQNTEIPTAVQREHDRVASEPGSIGEPHLKGSQIKELIFNDGGKGYGIKNGQEVDGSSFYSGVWAGHANHVHVAAGPKTAVALGKLAQKMGLHVGENPHFGGVDPVHVPGSYHYKGEAIDVSSPDPKKMAAFARRVKRYSDSR